jgi:hypothetical protein
MKVSRNDKGCGPFRPGHGYIVEGAPAVRDIEVGGTWVFNMGREDCLTFVDTSEKQALAFPTDEAYDDFKKARSIDFPWDYEGNGGTEPRRNPIERAASMFKALQGLSEQQFQDMGWPAMEQPQKTGGVKAAAAAAAAKAAEPKATKPKTIDRGDAR